MSSESAQTFKILTIGESNVGKTSILRRFVENKFSKIHLSTIGIDYRTKSLHVYGKNIKLKIWDTAGQERYHNITSQIYKGADGIMLVYDVTEETSFIKIKDWMEQIITNIGGDEISIVLLGNKCDVEERAITKERGQEMANSLKVFYYETSALNGMGINDAFEGLTKEIMKKKNTNHEIRAISLDSSKNQKKKKCC